MCWNSHPRCKGSPLKKRANGWNIREGKMFVCEREVGPGRDAEQRFCLPRSLVGEDRQRGRLPRAGWRRTLQTYPNPALSTCCCLHHSRRHLSRKDQIYPIFTQHIPCPRSLLFTQIVLNVSPIRQSITLFENEHHFLHIFITVKASGDLGIGLVWHNLYPSDPSFRSDCWNPHQTELNYLWWVLSCSQDDIRCF